MHLDMDCNHLASNASKLSIRELALQAFFRETKLHRDVQPLPAKGNASVSKASEMTFYASFWRTTC
jgi:hypothetical protein